MLANMKKELAACAYMVSRIPVHPLFVTAQDLADDLARHGMPTTVRTVQRRLVKLDGPFLLRRRPGAPAGWAWQNEAGACATRALFAALVAATEPAGDGPARLLWAASG